MTVPGIRPDSYVWSHHKCQLEFCAAIPWLSVPPVAWVPGDESLTSTVLAEMQGFSVTAENCRRTCPFSDYPDADSASAYTYQTILAVIAVGLPAMTLLLSVALFRRRQIIEQEQTSTGQARKRMHSKDELDDVSVEVSDRPQGTKLDQASAEHDAKGAFKRNGRQHVTFRTHSFVVCSHCRE